MKKAIKKPANKKASKPTARTKPKAKAKVTKSSKAPPKAINKKISKPVKKTAIKKIKKSAAKIKAKGFSILELFQLKAKRILNRGQAGDAWKHKKDLPPQDQTHKDEMRAKNSAVGKKSGFGGARHH